MLTGNVPSMTSTGFPCYAESSSSSQQPSTVNSASNITSSPYQNETISQKSYHRPPLVSNSSAAGEALEVPSEFASRQPLTTGQVPQTVPESQLLQPSPLLNNSNEGYDSTKNNVYEAAASQNLTSLNYASRFSHLSKSQMPQHPSYPQQLVPQFTNSASQHPVFEKEERYPVPSNGVTGGVKSNEQLSHRSAHQLPPANPTDPTFLGRREPGGAASRDSQCGTVASVGNSVVTPGINNTDVSKLRALVHSLVESSHLRIDPAFVPRPLYSTEPITQRGGKRYEADKYTIPPSSSSTFTVLSRGNASCRYIRMSLCQIPSTRQLLDTVGIPLVSVIQPFPCLGEFEDPVHLVDLNSESISKSAADGFDTEGPLRCTRCHAYGSPFTRFNDGWSTATCNFCGHMFTVPRHYQAVMADVSGYARYGLDGGAIERPELVYGIVDYVAPLSLMSVASTANDTSAKQRRPTLDVRPTLGGSSSLSSPSEEVPKRLAPSYCFVIDTSASAQQCDFTAATIGAIQYALDALPFPEITEICFITYNKDITFYAFPHTVDGNPNHPQALVVTDVNDPFYPASHNALFINVAAYRSVIHSFLEGLRKKTCEQSGNNRIAAFTAAQSCGNAALRAAVSLLQSRESSGAVRMFYASHPDLGVGSLDKMAMGSLVSTEQEKKTHLMPSRAEADFYAQLVAACITSGVSIDIFAACSGHCHIHLAGLCYASRKTGGLSHYYQRFCASRDYVKLCYDLSHLFLRPAGFDCIFKIRCSRGFSVDRVLMAASIGVLDSRVDVFTDPSTFRLPRLDSSAALVFVFRHDGAVPESERMAYVQFACLYTSVKGERRVRVATLSIPITTSLSTVFRYSEIESVLAYYVRTAVDAFIKDPKGKWKEKLTSELVNILFSYRLNCAATSATGQLILPDALKALPVFLSALFKHAAFRRASEMLVDEKEYFLSLLPHIPVHQLVNWMYPRLHVLHRSFTTIKGEHLHRMGLPVGIDNIVYLPPVIPCTGEKTTSDGLFLLDNGIEFLLYIGEHVDPAVRAELFGDTDPVPQYIADAQDLNYLRGELGERVRKVLQQIREEKNIAYPYQALRLIYPRSPEESYFLQCLVEDRLGSEPSYLDFLCQLHRAVHTKMEDA